MQLLRNMNRLLEQHPQSRRRHLAWHTPIIVPVYPQVQHKFENHCAAHLLCGGALKNTTFSSVCVGAP